MLNPTNIISNTSKDFLLASLMAEKILENFNHQVLTSSRSTKKCFL